MRLTYNKTIFYSKIERRMIYENAKNKNKSISN